MHFISLGAHYTFTYITISAFINSCYAACYFDEVIKPCSCMYCVVTCSGSQSYSLKNIFTQLSQFLKDEYKVLESFELTNSAISQLEDYVFK